jgi:hypothetical protein
MSMRGNQSIIFLYSAAKRYQRWIEEGIHPVVLLLADHDPAGYFMPGTVPALGWIFRLSSPFIIGLKSGFRRNTALGTAPNRLEAPYSGAAQP